MIKLAQTIFWMYIVSSFSIFIQIKEVNTDELTFIESYYHQNLSVNEIAKD